MLTSLFFLQQGNVRKSEKLMKIVNIEEEILHIFWSQIDPTRFRVKWISEKKNNDYILRLELSVM